MRLFNL